MSSFQEAVGRSAPFVRVQPPAIIAQRAPATTDTGYVKGASWIDESQTPSMMYFHLGGGVWNNNNLTLNTDDTFAAASNSTASSSLAIKTYADNLAIAGAPDWSESVKGIGQLASNAEAVTGTATDVAIVPSSLTARLAAPGAIGGTTPAAGAFTTIAASGLSSLSGSATILTAGTALNLASDADTAAVNLGTGAAARAITIGNVTAGTGVTVNTGTGHFTVNTTGAGDIILNSDDTVLIDADGVLELNSSTGVIGIGNDADANNINIGTGAAARTITLGNSTGATSVVLESGTGAINIGVNAIAHSTTIGNMTGASALVLEVGTGNFSLDGVTNSTYAIGASTTTGTITIGGTAQTGTLSVGTSSGIMTSNYSTGNGAKTVNVATGVSGNTLNVATGNNTSAQVVNISSGASAANSTVNILSGNGSAGTQTLNALTGTRAGAVNIGTGAAAHVIAVGSASAGAITVDTAAGISLDSSTASNFTVTGASADLTLNSVGGSVNITSTEDAASAIFIQADGGTSETIVINVDQGTGVASLELSSDVGGVTVSSGLASADAINLSASAGGIDLDSALQTNIASSQAAATAIQLTASDAAGGITATVGTGNFNIAGNLALTSVATKLIMNVGAATDFAGNSVLTAGTVTINNTNIATGDMIFLQRIAAGASTTLGELSYTISNGASFTVTSLILGTPGSTQTGDISTFAYFIVRPT